MKRIANVSIALMLAGLAWIISTSPATAAEGRIPVYLPGTAITHEGSYYVTENLTGTGSVPVIDVQSNGVDLDLNGFTLTQAAGPQPVIRVGRVDRFRLHGGSLTGGNRSIDWIPDCGNSTTIEDVTMNSPSAEAIHMAFGAGAVIRRVNVIAAGGDAITMTNSGEATVEGCAIHGGFAAGIRLTDVVSIKLQRNIIDDCIGHGITVDTAGNLSIGVIMRDNVIAGPGGEGIRLQNLSGGEIRDNHVDRTASNGIHLLSDTYAVAVRGNQVVGAQQDGIRDDGHGNSISDNHLGNCLGFGLHLAAGSNLNLFGANALTSNGGPSPTCTGTSVLFDFCNEGTSNASFGTNLVPTQPLF